VEALRRLELDRDQAKGVDEEMRRMRGEHEAELARMQADMANLLEKFNLENEASEENMEKLKAAHGKEVERLRAELDALRQRQVAEAGRHEEALAKLKLFHEKELEARAANSAGEFEGLVEGLKAEVALARRERAGVERELGKRYEEKLGEVGRLEEEVAALGEKLREAVARLESGGQNAARLNDAAERLGQEKNALQARVTELEFENASFTNRFEFQAKNLVQKSSKWAVGKRAD